MLNATLHHHPLFRESLARVAAQRGSGYYLTGGTIRDWLLKRKVNDLDITVPADGIGWARDFARQIKGTFVLLDQSEDVARVVWQGITIDFAGFREQATSIEDDLRRRDFTMNALAVSSSSLETSGSVPALIDPTGGEADLEAGVIRCADPDGFEKDPLRLLRAYRFSAELGLVIEPGTENLIRVHQQLVAKASGERVAVEMDRIMLSTAAAEAIGKMVDTGLLGRLFPELVRGVGMQQPAPHHLDVFGHSLETLRCMEGIMAEPERYFPAQTEELHHYFADGRRKKWLSWAALFHDLGKPATQGMRDDPRSGITYYNHDQAGAELFDGIADRLRWSREDRRQVARFIGMHMRPFHLNNARRKGNLTPRAYLRLVKAIESEFPGLFLLALADIQSARGGGRPDSLERELVELYVETSRIHAEHIEPVLAGPGLIDGNDLIALGLTPGPLFGEILTALESEQVEGSVQNRADALAWVSMYLDRDRKDRSADK